MKKWTTLVIVIIFITLDIDAQCVMCKATTESGDKTEQVIEGINSGILFLMGIPYLLLMTVGFILFKKPILEKFKS
jgi:hypothetical protein